MERGPEPLAAAPSTGRLFLSVFPSIMLPMFLAVADGTIVASALPNIAADMGDVERISWVVVAYLLANSVAAPVYGYLGDVFGRRRLMAVALTVFIVASVLCALAPSMALLSAARVLQGLGGGGLMALSQALVGEVVPPRQRGHYQGYLAAVATASSSFGPVAGGFLTQAFGWRSVFLINVPLGLLAILLTFRLTARRGTHTASWHFDWAGLLFFVTFVVPILFALERLQRFERSALPIVVACVAASLASLAVLVLVENRRASPLIPIGLLRQKTIWMADGMAMCHGATLTALVAFLPIYMRVVRGTSAYETGLFLLPVTAGIGISSMITGRIVTRTGRTMVFPSWGLIVSTLLLITFDLSVGSLSSGQLAILLGATALALGPTMGVVQLTVQGASGTRLLGAGAASVQLSRSVGASLGTAILGTVLFATLATRDPDAGRMFGQVLDRGPDALAHLEAARQAAIQSEIASAFRSGFMVLPIFTAIGAVLALLQPTRRV